MSIDYMEENTKENGHISAEDEPLKRYLHCPKSYQSQLLQTTPSYEDKPRQQQQLTKSKTLITTKDSNTNLVVSSNKTSYLQHRTLLPFLFRNETKSFKRNNKIGKEIPITQPTHHNNRYCLLQKATSRSNKLVNINYFQYAPTKATLHTCIVSLLIHQMNSAALAATSFFQSHFQFDKLLLFLRDVFLVGKPTLFDPLRQLCLYLTNITSNEAEAEVQFINTRLNINLPEPQQQHIESLSASFDSIGGNLCRAVRVLIMGRW